MFRLTFCRIWKQAKCYALACEKHWVPKNRLISSVKYTGPILDCQGKAIENVEEFRYLTYPKKEV